MVRVLGQQRGDPGIERDEADLEVIVPDPEREIVLSQGPVPRRERSGTVS
jgi:hypothetical protein